LLYWGRTLLSSSLATWQQLFGQDKHRWAFGCYLVHLFFNRQRFRADDFQIPQHRKALFVVCYAFLTHPNMQNITLIIILAILSFASCKGQTNSTHEPVTFVDTIKSFKKEIPSNDVFYILAKDKQKQLGLDSIENGFDNLQLRIWYGFSRVRNRKLVTIINKGKKWTATVYNMQVNWNGETETIIAKEIKQVTPKSGWTVFSKKLLDLKVVTLPPMDNISGYESGKDGKMFNVEVATKNQYRFYGYWEPQDYQNKFWQAKNMTGILDLFKTELNVER